MLKERSREIKRLARARHRLLHRGKRKEQKRRAEQRRSRERLYARMVWVWTHPEECAKHAAEMGRRLSERKRIKRTNRKARERNAPGRLSQGLYDRLFASQQGKCAVCRLKVEKMHLDHIFPLAGGGSNDDSNIQLLCPACNQSKSAKHPVEFMQSRGFLL